ncbi:hypothetical protein HYW44_02635 [Candidatus Daviesbacteria bacterium]|nr:hypothetical protein [Candidatus Daviesbacteria bacterium]
MAAPEKDFLSLRSKGYDPKFEGAIYPGFAPETRERRANQAARGSMRLVPTEIAYDPYGAPDPKFRR